MSHRHIDPCDPTETYGMPSRPCDRCRCECCIDCSTLRDGKRICDGCVWWLSLSESERKVAGR